MTFTIKQHVTTTITINDLRTGLEADFTLTENDIHRLIDSLECVIEADAGETGTSTFMSDNGENFTIYRIYDTDANVVRIESNTAEASINPDEAHQILETLTNL